jgi:hypothetical protein
MKNIYEVQAEVDPLLASEKLSATETTFVSCYVPADDLESAIRLARGQLKKDNYRVVELEWVVKIDVQDWAPEDENAPSKADLKAMQTSGEIAYGTFYCFEKDAGSGQE